jgi:hypothetical protein
MKSAKDFAWAILADRGGASLKPPPFLPGCLISHDLEEVVIFDQKCTAFWLKLHPQAKFWV